MWKSPWTPSVKFSEDEGCALNFNVFRWNIPRISPRSKKLEKVFFLGQLVCCILSNQKKRLVPLPPFDRFASWLSNHQNNSLFFGGIINICAGYHLGMVIESFRWRVREKTVIPLKVSVIVMVVLDLGSRRFGGLRIHDKRTEYQGNRKP